MRIVYVPQLLLGGILFTTLIGLLFPTHSSHNKNVHGSVNRAHLNILRSQWRKTSIGNDPQIAKPQHVTTPSSSRAAASLLPSQPGRARVQLKVIAAYPIRKIPDEVLAIRYDLVIFQAYTPDRSSPARIRAMKALNPNLKVLLYYLSYGTWSWQPDWPFVTQHENWFIHDAQGQRINATSPDAGGWWLMDIRNPGWRAYVINRTMGIINTYGFDGLFEDGPPSGLRNGWPVWSSPIPQNIADTWHADILVFLSETKQALGSKLYITNTTPWNPGSGGPDFDDTDFLNYVDGTMNEGFAHPLWMPGEARLDKVSWDWQQQHYQRNLNRGKIHLMISGIKSGSTADVVTRWQIFTFASYLLKADGMSAYFQWGYQGYFPELDTELGAPLGPAYLRDGVYQRDFTSAKVFVNASDRGYTVNLPEPIRTLQGKTVAQMTFQPWTAAILLK